MAYEVHIQKPFLWWNRTTRKKKLTSEGAAVEISRATGSEIKPSDLHLFLGKVFIIGGKKTITVHLR